MSESAKKSKFNPSSEKQAPVRSVGSFIDRFKDKPWWRLETALLVGAIVCGLFSGVLSHFNSLQKDQYYQDTYATNRVLVVNQDLEQGQIITKNQLELRNMLRSNMTQNHLTPNNVMMVVGKKTSVDLKRGDPLLISTIVGATEITSMALKIPPGKRLFSLTIEDPSVKNGFIKANDHVDILAYINLPKRGQTVLTVLQDITLVSIGSDTSSSSSSESSSNVSFFVTPQQSEVLNFALKVGTFSLSLRNPRDISLTNSTKGVAINEFLDYGKIHDASGGSELKVTERGRSLNKTKAKK